MNTKSDQNESIRVSISLEVVWRALIALGHQQLWLCPPDGNEMNSWLIITWDGLTVAELTGNSASWWLTRDASAIYTNPDRLIPNGLEELTCQSVQRHSVPDL